jgi:hypothetical protein
MANSFLQCTSSLIQVGEMDDLDVPSCLLFVRPAYCHTLVGDMDDSQDPTWLFLSGPPSCLTRKVIWSTQRSLLILADYLGLFLASHRYIYAMQGNWTTRRLIKSKIIKRLWDCLFHQRNFQLLAEILSVTVQETERGAQSRQQSPAADALSSAQPSSRLPR